jgi:proton glutamate symport protein
LQDWKIDGDQIDPAISVNLLVSRAGNIVYNIVAIFFALNLFDESITVALSGKAVLLAILTGLATAGLSGIAVVPVITMALEVMRVPSAPIIIPLLAIDPILGMVRAGITGVVALSGASLICSHAVPSRAGLMENGESV